MNELDGETSLKIRHSIPLNEKSIEKISNFLKKKIVVYDSPNSNIHQINLQIKS